MAARALRCGVPFCLLEDAFETESREGSEHESTHV
jgi:hypothetical protein